MLHGISEALIILNPNAGRAKGAAASARLDRARNALAAAGIQTQLSRTAGPGDATLIARRAVADRRQMVIVCGGDGTLNEAVNGLAGSRVPMALLPAGTANVLAKELGVPWNVERAASLVAHSDLRRIALGLLTTDSSDGQRQVQTRYFISVAGAGPDAAIVNAVSPALKARGGTLAYWYEGFRQLIYYRFPQFRASSGTRSIDATLIVVGRARNYGGPFKITTEADLFGDEFELMLCTVRSRVVYLGYLSLLSMGQLRRGRQAHFFKTASVRCESLGPSPAYLQVDGEPAGQLPGEFTIVPDALTLVVPKTKGSSIP